MASKLRWGGLRIEPYDPDAVDADGDQIVQEGTAWERPAGTRILDQLGREIVQGASRSTQQPGLRYRDSNGKEVSYTLRTVQQTPGGAASPLQRVTGIGSLREEGNTLSALGYEGIGKQGLSIQALGNEPIKTTQGPIGRKFEMTIGQKQPALTDLGNSKIVDTLAIPELPEAPLEIPLESIADPRVRDWVEEIRAGEAVLDDISDPAIVAAVERILAGNNSPISSETDTPADFMSEVARFSQIEDVVMGAQNTAGMEYSDIVYRGPATITEQSAAMSSALSAYDTAIEAAFGKDPEAYAGLVAERERFASLVEEFRAKHLDKESILKRVNDKKNDPEVIAKADTYVQSVASEDLIATSTLSDLMTLKTLLDREHLSNEQRRGAFAKNVENGGVPLEDIEQAAEQDAIDSITIFGLRQKLTSVRTRIGELEAEELETLRAAGPQPIEILPPSDETPFSHRAIIDRLVALRHGSSPAGVPYLNTEEQDRLWNALAEELFAAEGIDKNGRRWHTTISSTILTDDAYSHRGDVAGFIRDTETGQVIGDFRRSIYLPDPSDPDPSITAYNDIFTMSEGQGGTGIGSQFLTQTLTAQHAAGINKVTLTAVSSRPKSDRDLQFTGFTTWPGMGAELTGPMRGDDAQIAADIMGKSIEDVTADDVRAHAKELVGLDLVAPMVFDLTDGLPEELTRRPQKPQTPKLGAPITAAEADAIEARMQEASARYAIELAEQEAERAKWDLIEAAERQKPEDLDFPTNSEDVTVPTPYDLTQGMVVWSSWDPSGPRDAMADVYAGLETYDAAYARIRAEFPNDTGKFMGDTDWEFKYEWEQYVTNRRSAASLLNAISDSKPIDEELTRGEISEIPGYADTFVPGQPFTMDVRGFTTDPVNSTKFSTVDESKGGDPANKSAVVFVIKPGNSTALPLRYFDDNREFTNEKEHLLAGTYEVVTAEQQTRTDFLGESQTVTVITIVQTSTIGKPPTGADGIVGWR